MSNYLDAAGLETDQEDVDMIEGFGYLPVARIYDATVYEAPPHPPTGKMCLDES